MSEGLTRNAAKCLSCGHTIESKNRHDFVTCSCGKISVDGGLDYASRSWTEGEPEDAFEDLSTYGERPEPGPTAWDIAEKQFYDEQLLRALRR